IGKRLDPAMEDVRPTIEDHFLDARLDRAFADQFADGGGCGRVGTSLQSTFYILFERRSGGNGMPLRIVDDLGVDVLRRAIDRKTQPIARDFLDLAAYTRRTALGAFLGGHDSLSLPCKTGAAV